MGSTAKGMVENVLHLVREYGFVPNGESVDVKGNSVDVKGMVENVLHLVREYGFVLNGESVDVKGNSVD
eukprot:1187133-Prorocentrum_minimum.AAC.1